MEKKAKILVIDDDPDYLDTTKFFLLDRGYEVVTAASPDEGAKALEESRPDLVILDIMMPEGIEGFQWVSKIRHHRDESLRGVPIIVASSIHQTTGMRFGRGDSDESGDYLPVQAFLEKPLDPDQLAAKIEAILGNG